MFCIYCGQQLPGEARFCNCCGKQTNKQVSDDLFAAKAEWVSEAELNNEEIDINKLSEKAEWSGDTSVANVSTQVLQPGLSASLESYKSRISTANGAMQVLQSEDISYGSFIIRKDSNTNLYYIIDGNGKRISLLFDKIVQKSENWYLLYISGSKYRILYSDNLKIAISNNEFDNKRLCAYNVNISNIEGIYYNECSSEVRSLITSNISSKYIAIEISKQEVLYFTDLGSLLKLRTTDTSEYYYPIFTAIFYGVLVYLFLILTQ